MRSLGQAAMVAMAVLVSGMTTLDVGTVTAAERVPGSFADLAEKLSPAVVNISTSQMTQASDDIPVPEFPPGTPFEDFFKDFFDRQQRGGPRRVSSLGSGFVIDPSGIVVTNNHVIEGADEIQVNFSDGTTLPAELIGKDAKTDLAVLKVKPEKDLVAVSFGESDRARVGEWVMAIGNPFGLGGSVSVGIISARNRDINAGPYDDFIQTDAAINRGNSGGPLFNMDGQVIGVNTAIISPSGGSIGIGFAIPSTLAANVVSQLQQFGETRRGWLGVRIQTVTDEIAESLGLNRPRGALVAGVADDGPAADAGIQQGDIILSFDGKGVSEMRELPRIVADTTIGEAVDVMIWRDGKEQSLKVTVGKLDETGEAMAALSPEQPSAPLPGAVTSVDSLGLTIGPINDDSRTRFEIPDGMSGVVIEEVDPDGAAAEKGIRPGDVIVEVAQEEVRTPAEALAKIEEIASTDRKSVLLLLNRAGELRFVALRLRKTG